MEGGGLNIISQWGGDHKKGGNQIFKVQWGEAKAGEHDFRLKVSGGKNLRGNYDDPLDR